MWHLQELQDSSNLPVAPTPLDGNATLPLWRPGRDGGTDVKASLADSSSESLGGCAWRR